MSGIAAVTVLAFFVIPLIFALMAWDMRDENRRYSVAGYRRGLHYSPPDELARGARS
jgi:hypothetical protein